CPGTSAEIRCRGFHHQQRTAPALRATAARRRAFRRRTGPRTLDHHRDRRGIPYAGTGEYYAATNVEAQLCKHEEAIVVGGGNSAGQAAVFLSGNCRHVHVLVRSKGLADSMSRYLIRRIEE